MANRIPLVVDTSTNRLAELPTYDTLYLNPSDISANSFIGDGSQLSNVVAATVTTNAQPNITSLGTLIALNVNGNSVITGNLVVSGNLSYTNVDQIYVTDPLVTLGGGPNNTPLTSNDGMDRGALLDYYTTAPVTAFMGWDNSNGEFAFGSNVSSTNNVVTFNTLGNVRAQNFIGNVSSSQPNITTVGTLANLSANNINLLKFNESVSNGGNTGATTITPDASLGSIFNYRLTGNITINSIANVANGTSMTLILTQDGTGNRLLSSTWKFAGNSKTLSTAANTTDVVCVFYDGSTYYASLTKGYA